MSTSHPYKKLERLKVWKITEKAFDDLVSNGDLKELTARHYIVGYLLEQLQKADLLSSEQHSSNGTMQRVTPEPAHHR